MAELAEPRAAPSSPMAPVAARVAERRVESASVVTLTLEPVDAPFPEVAAGRFCMLWAPGVGESAISVSGQRPDGAIEHTVARVGAVTEALCAAPVGAVLGVRGPFGRGWDLVALEGRDVLVVAGGIGLAPLRLAVHHLLADDGARRVQVLVGARTPADLLYAEELATWSGAAGVEVHTTVDRRTDGWHGAVGVVTRLLGASLGDPAATAALICGPEVMLRVTARGLVDLGVAPAAVQVSLERNMACGVGHCGRCQLGPHLLCQQGPVHRWPDVAELLEERER